MARGLPRPELQLSAPGHVQDFLEGTRRVDAARNPLDERFDHPIDEIVNRTDRLVE